MSQLEKMNNSLPTIKTILNDFFDTDKLFSHGLLDSFSRSIPAVNIIESEKKFELNIAAPGFEKEDFKIEVENGVLKVSAEKDEQKSEEKRNYTKKEFNYNSFVRSFVLPEIANQNDMNAEYKNGLLILSIAKIESNIKSNKKEININ